MKRDDDLQQGRNIEGCLTDKHEPPYTFGEQHRITEEQQNQKYRDAPTQDLVRKQLECHPTMFPPLEQAWNAEQAEHSACDDSDTHREFFRRRLRGLLVGKRTLLKDNTISLLDDPQRLDKIAYNIGR